MASKLQLMQALSDKTSGELTTLRGNWQRFLDTAARLYKYSFPDQMLIYAQRPDAVAVAPIELWNDTFDRWVRRGSKGIALIDDTGMYPRLKYVFDVNDTEPSRFRARPVTLWEMRQEHKAPVLVELAKSYEDINEGDSLAEAFRNIAKQLAAEYYSDNETDIKYRAEDSVLEPQRVIDGDGEVYEERDSSYLESSFVNALENSVAYTLMSRCGLNTEDYFSDADFQKIADFDTTDMVYAIGTATSELSEQVLRDVEIVIKKYERVQAAQLAQNAERSNDDYDRNPYVQPNRGLSASESHVIGGNRGTDPAGSLRTDAQSVPQGTQDNQLQPPAADGEAIPAPTGGGHGGDGEARTPDDRADGSGESARQGDGAVGVDGGDERLESASGGNGGERADLRVNLNLEQILSTSAVTAAEVDSILRDGGNSRDSNLRIAAFFAKGKDNAANTEFLKREYLERHSYDPKASGKGLDFGNHSVCAWYDDDGISLAIGTTAKNNIHRVTIPWETAAERIGELFNAGQYVTKDVLADALDNEHHELAGRLWNFYRDDMSFMPEEWDAVRGGYPETEAFIKDALDDDTERQAILDRLEADVSDFIRSGEKRSWHNPSQLLSDMRDTMIVPRSVPAAEFASKPFEYFITQDEIDALLLRGGNYTESKYRIFSFFLSNGGDKERIELLKEAYGHGGGSWSDTDGWHDAAPSKGLSLSRGRIGSPDAEVNLGWNAVARRIDTLIKTGQYMSRTELDGIASYEKIMLARSINAFYYDLPDEYPRPFAKGLDFHYPHDDEWSALNDFLSDGERVSATVDQMRYIFENTPDNDRYYSSRKAGLERLTSFQNGNYTLFPGAETLPEPGTPTAVRYNERVAATPAEPRREIVMDIGERIAPAWGEPAVTAEQLSIFDAMRPLPSVEEQRDIIDRLLRQEAAEIEAASVVLENDTDAVLLNISADDKARLYEQFADNPRSRAAVNLVKEIYGDALPFPLPQAVKRITELVEMGMLDGLGDPYDLFDRVRDELSERGFAVSGEIVEDGINEFREQVGHGEFADIADFIVDEFLTEEPDMELGDTPVPTEKHLYLAAVGDFYELYGEQATAAASALGLTLLERDGEPMVGFPKHALESNTERLAEAGYAVFMAESDDAVLEKSIDTNRAYAVGDILWLDERKFVIDEIGDYYSEPDDLARRFGTYGYSVKLTDITGGYPLMRSMYSAEIDYKLDMDERNAELSPLGKVDEATPEVTEEIETESEVAAEPVTPPDFGAVAQTVYDRVMADENFAYHLQFAQSRSALRSPLTAALDRVIGGLKAEEPDVYGDFFNDDNTDALFDHVYKTAWANRPQQEQPEAVREPSEPAFTEITDPAELAEVAEVFPEAADSAKFTAERFFREYDTDYYLIRSPQGADYAPTLSRDELKLITNPAKNYVICAEACYIAEEEMARLNIKFRKMPRDFGLLPSEARARITEIAPQYREQWQADQEFEARLNATAPIPAEPVVPAKNFRITDDHLGEGGAKAKFRGNIDAIRTLQAIEAERRYATPDEQEILSRYVGWGGLPQAFDPDNSDWTQNCVELKELLTPDEYDSARASTLNAHYTTPIVIKAMWDAVERMGFKSGNILEPSCGIGNFLGLVPQDLWQSKLYGVELDSVTARIAKQLYPKANIQQTGFEKTEFSDAFFDLAIGNVPFGQYGVADSRYDKHHFSIHDYFFAKTLDKVRPGGVVAFITSKFTMDSKNPEVRKYLAQRAELLGAVRLPNNAFLKNAGTETNPMFGLNRNIKY